MGAEGLMLPQGFVGPSAFCNLKTLLELNSNVQPRRDSDESWFEG